VHRTLPSTQSDLHMYISQLLLDLSLKADAKLALAPSPSDSGHMGRQKSGFFVSALSAAMTGRLDTGHR